MFWIINHSHILSVGLAGLRRALPRLSTLYSEQCIATTLKPTLAASCGESCLDGKCMLFYAAIKKWLKVWKMDWGGEKNGALSATTPDTNKPYHREAGLTGLLSDVCFVLCANCLFPYVLSLSSIVSMVNYVFHSCVCHLNAWFLFAVWAFPFKSSIFCQLHWSVK